VFIDLIASLTSPSAYRRFAGEKPSRTAAYTAFLSLIFVVALSVAIRVRLTPLFDQTFDWLKTTMPAVTFSAGKVTSTAPTPTLIEHPRYKEVAVMIDTNRTDPVTVQQLGDLRKQLRAVSAKALAYLTSNALYLERDGRLEVFDLAKSASAKAITVDAQSYREMERVFNWLFYPLVVLFFFVVFCISLCFFGAIYGLAGMLVASLTGAELGFGALFRLALHAQSASVLLRAVDALSPVTIPLAGALSLALSVTYLTLGIRAAGRPDSAPTPPAPAA